MGVSVRMSSEPVTTSNRFLDRLISEERRAEIFHKRIEIASTVLLALATIATAWGGYQSAKWGGEQTSHSAKSATAIVKSGHFANLAEQRLTLQVNVFSQYVEAVSKGNLTFADFLAQRFPEPLKTAAVAWKKTDPWNNPDAPATPFQLPEFVLAETVQAEHWEQVATIEAVAAEVASEISDRYLMFTIIFASVLFFGGVSGKFGWQPLDIAVLLIGSIAFLIGLIVMFTTPII